MILAQLNFNSNYLYNNLFLFKQNIQIILSKLLSLLEESRRDSFHMQRLYKRRKFAADGKYASNWGSLMERSALDD